MLIVKLFSNYEFVKIVSLRQECLIVLYTLFNVYIYFGMIAVFDLLVYIGIQRFLNFLKNIHSAKHARWVE